MATLELRRLSPKIKYLWFMQYIVAGLIVWIVLSVVAVSIDLPVLSRFSDATRMLVVLAVVMIFLLPVLLWLELKYRSFTYTLTDESIIIREGVIAKKQVDIPYVSIENVDVKKPVIYRLLGLGVVSIDTAGGTGKEGVLPGVDRPDDLVNEILERIKAVRGAGEKAREERSLMLLENILNELVGLRNDIQELFVAKEEHRPRKRRKKSEKREIPSPTEPIADTKLR
ncbi:PH domain-containing protein [Candidatus Micrarchaeota archaeon]|nr:PH domain-containing protein [Candidatus Micrarchaeota archaeon]